MILNVSNAWIKWSKLWFGIGNLFKTRQHVQRELFMKSPASNGDWITVMTSRNGILNESARKCLTTTSQVIYLTDSCHPFKESNFAMTKAAYWSCMTCSCSLLPVKVFHSVRLLRHPFCALDWILFHELLNKSIRSF